MTFWILKLVLGAAGLFKTASVQGQGSSGGVPGSSGYQTITLSNPLACNDVGCVAQKIVDGLFTISIPVVSIMVLVGAFQIITAGGNTEKVSSGRKTILYAAIGFVVVLIADSVVKILRNLF